MIDKTYTGNYYDGCLNELKSELNISLPPERGWNGGIHGINLIGDPINSHNSHQYPYYNPPSYIQITFENRFIYPTHYFLEGRRFNSYNLLKSWNFEGLTIDGEWKILHSQKNNQFNQREPRLFGLFVKEFFKGFQINMTYVDIGGVLGLCLG